MDALDRLRDLLDVRSMSLDRLRALNNVAWVEALGDLNFAYAEMPTWIRLARPSEVQAAHLAFVAIMKPFLARLDGVEIGVAYSVVSRGQELEVDLFSSTAEVLLGHSEERPCPRPRPMSRMPSGGFSMRSGA